MNIYLARSTIIISHYIPTLQTVCNFIMKILLVIAFVIIFGLLPTGIALYTTNINEGIKRIGLAFMISGSISYCICGCFYANFIIKKCCINAEVSIQQYNQEFLQQKITVINMDVTEITQEPVAP